jgi:hypothetical protein
MQTETAVIIYSQSVVCAHMYKETTAPNASPWPNRTEQEREKLTRCCVQRCTIAFSCMEADMAEFITAGNEGSGCMPLGIAQQFQLFHMNLTLLTI